MLNTQPYNSVHSEIYDYNIWFANYNYTENAQRIITLLEDVSCNSILELGSGTGSYLPELARYYAHVEGLEISTDMRDISLKKYPQFVVHIENMIDFHLAKQYDAIGLFCGTIGYLAQSNEAESVLAIQKMIRCCRKHLHSSGIIIIETYDQPHTAKEWVSAEQHILEDKYFSHHTVKTRENSRFVVLTHHLLVTPKTPNTPTIYTKEIHRGYLCTTEEVIALFEKENFRVKVHIPSFAIEGRDLLIFELAEFQ